MSDSQEQTIVEQTPSDILQAKINELVKQVSDLQKQNAQLQVQLTDKQIQLDAANHLLDARTSSSSPSDDSVADLIDENDLSAALMAGGY